MTAQPRTFEEMEKRWRSCSGVRDLTGDYYGAEFSQCADDLASLEPHYVHKDRLRELRDECKKAQQFGFGVNVNAAYEVIEKKLTALLADPLPKGNTDGV